MNKKNIKYSSNRSFGIVFFIVFLIISVYPEINDTGSLRIWSLVLALIFLTLGLLNSIFLTPLNKAWIKFGFFLGKFISPVVMAFVFFAVVTPTGFLLRIFKKDVLNLKKNNEQSYWIKKDGPKSKMKNQF